MQIGALTSGVEAQSQTAVSVNRNTTKASIFSNALDSFEKMTDKARNMTMVEASKNDKREDGVVLVTEEWRDMARKGDEKTGEKYQELVKEFGAEYIKQLDKKFGNGDGVLTFDEYFNSEVGDIPADAPKDEVKEMKDMIKIAFNRINLDGNKHIDAKEMTALLAAMDYDDDSRVDGCITIKDFMGWSIQLGEKGKNFLDDLLKYNYESYFGKN